MYEGWPENAGVFSRGEVGADEGSEAGNLASYVGVLYLDPRFWLEREKLEGV